MYRIFGDAIYPMLPQLYRMHRAPAPGSPAQALNAVMATVRVSVEWGFNLVTNMFQGIDFIRWQRMFMTKPALQYRVASLLANCVNIIRGTNQVAAIFLCPLPTLADYLAGTW